MRKSRSTLWQVYNKHVSSNISCFISQIQLKLILISFKKLSSLPISLSCSHLKLTQNRCYSKTDARFMDVIPVNVNVNLNWCLCLCKFFSFCYLHFFLSFSVSPSIRDWTFPCIYFATCVYFCALFHVSRSQHTSELYCEFKTHRINLHMFVCHQYLICSRFNRLILSIYLSLSLALPQFLVETIVTNNRHNINTHIHYKTCAHSFAIIHTSTFELRGEHWEQQQQ